MSRLARLLIVSVTSLLLLMAPAVALADPAEDLAAAEVRKTAATADVEVAERELSGAEAASAPLAARAERVGGELSEAEQRLAAAEEELAGERRAAAEEVETARQAYDDEKSDHETTTAVGIALVVAALVGAGALVVVRSRRRLLSRRLTWLLASGAGVLFVAGVALALVPAAPEEPIMDAEVLELAEASDRDPAKSPSPEMEAIEAELPALEEAAAPLEDALKRSQEEVEAAQQSLTRAEEELSRAEREALVAQRVVNRIESEEREEASYREEASSIDYDQLIKNPEAHQGEKVVYTGQIFQIVEEGGIGFMLLSVTDEGYGFWDDNIWVNFYEPIGAAEEDIITVYGKLTGSEEYETQIGGSTFVPRMNARYIDE